MNIAFFSESYKPYVSGVTNSMETLKNGLEADGHKVTIFAPWYPNTTKEQDTYRFPSIPSNYPGYRLAIPIPGKVLRTLKERKIEIIHTHSPYQLGQLAKYYAKKLEVPIVFTMHTILTQYMHYVPIIPQDILVSFTNSYIKSFCNRCSAIIAPTGKVAEQLRSIGIEKRIEVIPTGLDLSYANSADPSYIKKKHQIPENAKILLFVGRLAKEKNIGFLLDAFKEIVKTDDNVFLLIAAGGPLEQELKRMNHKNVVFAGAVSYPRIFDYYAAADLFVFSSLSETQGLVLAEAMSCGVPQVAIKAEGVSDVVIDGATGFLTNNSQTEFNEKIKLLLSNEQKYNEMSQASIVTAKNKYSKEVFTKKIEQLYNSVL